MSRAGENGLVGREEYPLGGHTKLVVERTGSIVQVRLDCGQARTLPFAAGETRQEAIADAVALLEQAADVLQGPPPRSG